MNSRILLFLTLVFLPFQMSYADELSNEILYLCSPERGIFSLTSLLEVDAYLPAGGDLTTAIPLSGHKKLDSNVEHMSNIDLQCTLGRTIVTARVVISPPSIIGDCGGNTKYTIYNLQINGKNVTEDGIDFNNLCRELSAQDIEIKVINDKIFTKICYSEIFDHTNLECDTFYQ